MRAGWLVVLATGLATWLAGGQAWGHTFPPVRTVVVQVEKCEVAVLVGYRPGSGEETEAVLARASSRPKSQALDAMREVMTARALAPLKLQVDGTPLVPTSVRAKIGVEPGGSRPMVVVLVTYGLPRGRTLALQSTDTRSTRISWADRASGRVEISHAPTQGHWYPGVASFLLSLAPGDSTCAPPSALPSRSASSR